MPWRYGPGFWWHFLESPRTPCSSWRSASRFDWFRCLSGPRRSLRRRLILTIPGLVGAVLILAGTVFGGDWLKQQREAARPVPSTNSPNVLFIVLDTVRADRLSLYGYQRRTTPMLERLAKRGTRFDAARATVSWTLPSHASFFTGRWPHELDIQWTTPWRVNFPTLAQYVGSHGYGTAGFVANTTYCSYDSGLSSGFTHYEDYLIERLGPLPMAILVDKFLLALFTVEFRYDGVIHFSLQDFLQRWFYGGFRPDAAIDQSPIPRVARPTR